MKISHEVPLSLLKESRKFNDYQYALVHLFEEHKEYFEFYKESIALGSTVLLDNSVFELESAFDPERFVYWINQLKPTEYIIPDVLDNADATIANIKEWNSKYNVPGIKIGVIQGETFDDAIRCYETIYPLVDKLAVSFNCKFYEVGSDNVLLDWVNGRQSFLETIGETCKKPVHLLGCSLPKEFLYYKNEPFFNFIESVDTSNPVVHALNGIRYNDDGLDTKISTKLIEYMNTPIEQIDFELLKHNVDVFRSLC